MIISDLCDEYAVLVSQNKAPAYGYDNTNVPYGLVIDDDGTLVRVRPLGTSAGRSPSISFRCRLVSPFIRDCGELPLRQRHVPARRRHQRNAKRSAQAFQACGELHRRILDGVKDRAASAVCAFFSKAPQWQTAQRLMGTRHGNHR